MNDSNLPEVGDTASVEHVFTQEDVATFARLSGDDNPVHLDEAAAQRMGFSGTIVHGMLAAGLISRLLGTRLPGPGTIYLRQELRFKQPILPDQAVVASVSVVGRRDDKPVLELSTVITSQGQTAIEGSATVLVRRP